ncbi:MAG: glycerophosphodiester phosphodiesterase [Burkholderiaceae bacterium]|jgi:glycerophosphoryl diester phosphodiesterase|nr:glycerophosphodiester phosphodiesterase [Burkholderiales bacterium]MCZ8101425.1 glycerophosphodiester phosphodiesterase [Burkholderiales bacterium]MCZ8341013.1 glycerophosphodiester phosphodiesterase [Burkholderiaceae bacterium]
MSETDALPRWQVDFDRWPYPAVCAHRGAGTLAPENTLAAFRVGASHGQSMFEFDVKLSADGKPFLLHDATLDRTTSGRGAAGGATLAELAQLDAGSWHSAPWAGEPVPAFANVVAWLRANGHLANVEIKPSPGREAETGALVAIAAAHAWRDAAVPPLLSSFSEAALAAARRTVPTLPYALLVDTLPEDWLERVRAHGCVALDANHRVLTEAVVSRAHAERLRVLCYTVNDPARAATLRGWGVDCVITDAVDTIRP